MSKIEVNTVDVQCGSTLTLGSSGKTVTLATGASQSGFGRTGTVDWQTTIKTGDFTAVSGEGYFVNTTSGEITMTLPSSPSAGAIVAVKDYANTFDSNKLIIGRGGSNIAGAAQNSDVTQEGIGITLVYADATKGWLVTESGLQSEAPGPEYIAASGGNCVSTVCTNYKVHKFTSPGTFTVCSVGNAAGSNTVSYMVVAGGAGSGANAGGGGGAGGFRESESPTCSYTQSPISASGGLPVSVQGYSITVGGGGAGSTNANCKGVSGSVSTFSTITSAGGGGGGSGSSFPGNPGGSGGGARANQGGTGGTGNTPPVSPSQGNNGGNTAPSPTPAPYLGGGGGGATAVGATGNPGNGAGGA